MNKMMTCALAMAGLAVFAGCGQKQERAAPATQTPPAPAAPLSKVVVANPKGSVKVGDQAVCVICNKNEGKTYKEPVAETLDYKGKTYAFCNEGEKAEFISDPAKYAQAQ